MKKTIFLLMILTIGLSTLGFSQVRSVLYPESWQSPGSADFNTDKVMQDWSYAGYHTGNEPIPVKIPGQIYNVVTQFNADPTGNNDATHAIQTAIDDAEAAGGGTVYLPEGLYKISKSSSENYAHCLIIDNDGVVIKGDGPDKTFIYNSSDDMRQDRIIHFVGGINWWKSFSDPVNITQDLNTPTLNIPVASTDNYNIGDLILIRNTIGSAWKTEIGVPSDWEVGNLEYCRKIVDIDYTDNVFIVDAPIRYALKTRDNSRVTKAPVMIKECGIEDLSIGNKQQELSGFNESDTWDAGKGAYYTLAATAILMERVTDSWIKNVKSYKPADNLNAHLLACGIRLYETKNITIEDCHFQRPQSGGGGGNGYMYQILGNETMIKNCLAEYCRHGFVMASMVASGNVFYNCKDIDSNKQTGSVNLPLGTEIIYGVGSDHHQKFSHSNLFDQCEIDSSMFLACFRSSGDHSVTAAHSMYWNTIGTNYFPGDESIIYSDQAKYGYIIGTSGPDSNVSVSIESPYDFNTEPIDHMEHIGQGENLVPQSLYMDQWNKRLGTNPACGNTILDMYEECDDGNTVDGDGCSSICMIETNTEIIVAASSDDGHIAQNTMDGNLDPESRWSAEGDGQWIKFDLGSLESVMSIDIAFFKGNERSAIFDIEISSDDSNWIEVFSGNSSGKTLNYENFDFSDRIARYVKITGHGNSSNNWNSITEVIINSTTDFENVCGNGILEDTEECDDSNTNNGDGCSSVCVIETNIALNKTVKVSSIEGNDNQFNGSGAVDGNASTRWASQEGNDPEWIAVDLGKSFDIKKIKLKWEAAFAKKYRIEASNDSSVWTGNDSAWITVFEENDSNGDIDDIELSVNARYIRLYGLERGTSYGYSIFEFEVYGSDGSPAEYTLNANTDGHGSVVMNPGGGTYSEGTLVTLTAKSDNGWVFDHWEDGISGSDNPIDIVISANMTVKAIFREEDDSDDLDIFNIPKLYPSIQQMVEWNSLHWANGKYRELSSHGRDEYDPTNWTQMRGSGRYIIDGNGILELGESQPRIYITGYKFNGSDLDESVEPEVFWKNVEVTVYYKRTGTDGENWGGMIIGTRSGPEGHTSDNYCSASTYYARMRHDGKWDFAKELTHPDAEYWGTALHQQGELWNGPLLSNRWIGMKFVIYNLNEEHVKMEFYYDKTSGGNPDLISDPDNWEKVGELIDNGNWPVPIISDCIGTDYIDEDKVNDGKSTQVVNDGGGVVFIRNTGADKAEYKWLTIREIYNP